MLAEKLKEAIETKAIQKWIKQNKAKILKLRTELRVAEARIVSALNHVRDLGELAKEA